jgi:RNA-binding protein YlmH
MENSKKHSMDKKQDSIQEPETDYKTTFTEKLDPTNTDEQEVLLQKLLKKGLEESKMGQGISNEEMKRRTKLRYPFLK